jgi:hypothetical protein
MAEWVDTGCDFCADARADSGTGDDTGTGYNSCTGYDSAAADGSVVCNIVAHIGSSTAGNYTSA